MTYSICRFFDEIELLKIRLGILSDVVDKFILIESRKTVQGHDKPLYFTDNKSQFDGFNVESFVIESFDYSPRLETAEARNWNLAYPAFAKIEHSDTVLISDLDEIPNPEVVKEYKTDHGVVGLQMAHFNYYLNFKGINQKRWRNYVMKLCSGGNLEHSTPHGIRWFDSFHYGKHITNAGWHFSYVGGAESMVRKITANSKNPHCYNEERVKRTMASGCDVLDQAEGVQFAKCSMEEMPKFVQENESDLRQKGLLI